MPNRTRGLTFLARLPDTACDQRGRLCTNGPERRSCEPSRSVAAAVQLVRTHRSALFQTVLIQESNQRVSCPLRLFHEPLTVPAACLTSGIHHAIDNPERPARGKHDFLILGGDEVPLKVTC